MKLTTKYNNTIQKGKDGVVSYFWYLTEELLSNLNVVQYRIANKEAYHCWIPNQRLCLAFTKHFPAFKRVQGNEITKIYKI